MRHSYQSNPQPVAPVDIDSIATPGRISLAHKTTLVTAEGEVTLVDVFAPGHRKLVRAALGSVKVVGDNVEPTELENANDWVLFEQDGYVWRVLYRSSVGGSDDE